MPEEYWPCCNHCYDEHGDCTHENETIDRHTVPCNEMVDGKRCQSN